MTNAFDPRYSIDRSFQALAARLEPLIAATLSPHLGGLSWTAILEERDNLRGRAPGVYKVSDPQAQLKILTERLGSIGFPFDDHTRTVSILGGELRIARNRWAHHGELTPLDAWRTSDFAVRLLERLGDDDGVLVLDAIRDEAFDAVAREKGIAEHAVPISQTDSGAPVADVAFVLRGREPVSDGNQSGDGRRRFGGGAEQNLIGPFEPWPVVPVGGVEVIDDLPKKWAKERVRAVAAEIVDYEGPVELRRLAQLTAGSFGVVRLSERREKKIVYQIRQITEITVDADKFAWPTGIDRDRWRGFRTSDGGASRELLAVSPVEIANAMRALSLEEPRLEGEALDRAVLGVFGKSRLTAAFRAHLAKARAVAGQDN